MKIRFLLVTWMTLMVAVSVAHGVETNKVDLSCKVNHGTLNSEGRWDFVQIAEQRTDPFTLGVFPAPNLDIPLPAPFTDVRLSVNNALIRLQGETEWLANISPAFVRTIATNKTEPPRQYIYATRVVYLDIQGARIGSRVVLEAFFMYDTQAMLRYRCEVTFLN